MADTDRVKKAAEIVRAEADALEKQHKALWPSYAPTPSSADYKQGKIDGLRSAGELLDER